MHDVLRARVMRKIESLPEEQIYQVLDYIEFLESRYGSPEDEQPASGFQRMGEGLEDRMRKRSFKPSNLREAFQVIAAADRALSGVARAGRQLFDDLAGGSDAGDAGAERRRDAETGGEADAGFSDLSDQPDRSDSSEAARRDPPESRER
ncbi:MAG: hypothetical protein OXI83_03340 [Gemmatimonadota bacterium]|nr:hypothetical protein [Gemmatimonadota bacterium]MYB05592.1 DUF2281 domain-containing protein [Gemmatimonadota bacterium]MYG22800.1 DUF2281 domain-containing protein [Gemmatimonadota bacterium]MYJ40760.1 DUF2281 domain-containing protein [Gemmatimonadota bacterium]